MIISLVLSILGLFSSSPNPEASVDDVPFRLCYRFTSAVLFIFSSLLGLQDAFGKNKTFFYKSCQYCECKALHTTEMT